jgi:hypothetical protein
MHPSCSLAFMLSGRHRVPPASRGRTVMLPVAEPSKVLSRSGAAGTGGIAMAAARRLMALAAGVSPRLRPPDPLVASGRQGCSRGFSSSFVRSDGTQEAAEVESEVAPSEPGEGDGSMVNGEDSEAEIWLRCP